MGRDDDKFDKANIEDLHIPRGSIIPAAKIEQDGLFEVFYTAGIPSIG